MPIRNFRITFGSLFPALSNHSVTSEDRQEAVELTGELVRVLTEATRRGGGAVMDSSFSQDSVDFEGIVS